jgi:hypothetical protein
MKIGEEVPITMPNMLVAACGSLIEPGRGY